MEFLSHIFTRDFLIYLFYKVFSLLFMVLALYLIFLVEQTNFILVAVLFASSLFFSTSALRMDPKPLQVQCLQNKGFMISFFVPNAMSVSIVLIALALFGGTDFGDAKWAILLGSAVVLLMTLSIYLKEYGKFLQELEKKQK